MSSDDETSSEDDGYEESIKANDDSDIDIDQESLPHYLTLCQYNFFEIGNKNCLIFKLK